MYNIGEYVVCPGHGVGEVQEIEHKEVGGLTASFYQIKIVSNGMKVMVPVQNIDSIRSLVNDEEVQEVFDLLNNHDVQVDNSTWNRRYRDYMNKIKTGSLLEIADVLRSLFLLKENKTLSFGERKMLEQCKDLIVKEIALAKGGEERDISGQIEQCFNS